MPVQALRAGGRARRGPDRRALVHLGAGIGNVVLATPLLVALDALGLHVDLRLSADYPDTDTLLRGWSIVGDIHRDDRPVDLARYEVLVPALPPFYWPARARAYADRRNALARPPDARFYEDEQGYYLDFARALGWPPDRRPVYRLPIAPAPHGAVSTRTVALAPGCKTGEMRAKRWPGFARLAALFDDVAVLGTADDLHGADGAPLRFPSHVRMLAGTLTLRETAEALAGAGVVVGNDSGLSHVAAATGAPTVMLFGPTPHAALGALPPNAQVLRAGRDCEPCWFGARLDACGGDLTCLHEIGVDAVAAAVTRILGSGARTAPPAVT